MTALNTSADGILTLMQSLDKRITEEFPSRVLNNIKVCVAWLCLFERMLKRFGLSFKECGGLTLEELVNAAVGAVRSSVTDDGGRLNAIETALLVFERMSVKGLLIEGLDYRIRKGRTTNIYQVGINILAAFDKYTAYLKQIGQESGRLVSTAQYTKQVKKTEYYAGESQGKFRFNEADAAKDSKDKDSKKVCWLNIDKLVEKLGVTKLAGRVYTEEESPFQESDDEEFD